MGAAACAASVSGGDLESAGKRCHIWNLGRRTGVIEKAAGEGVVLFHGIMRTSRSMKRLAAHLERRGYAILNLDYPSTRHSLEDLSDMVHLAVEGFAASVERVHFVGFSMGGLLVRAYLASHRPTNLGRIVMIGTPNNGSEVADMLRRNILYGKLFGPAGQQLVTDQSPFRHIFADEGYELGIVAGRSIFNPAGALVFGRPNDGKVSVDSTLMPGCQDHIVVRRNHTLLILAPQTLVETSQFLETGRFSVGAERMLSIRIPD